MQTNFSLSMESENVMQIHFVDKFTALTIPVKYKQNVCALQHARMAYIHKHKYK